MNCILCSFSWSQQSYTLAAAREAEARTSSEGRTNIFELSVRHCFSPQSTPIISDRGPPFGPPSLPLPAARRSEEKKERRRRLGAHYKRRRKRGKCFLSRLSLSPQYCSIRLRQGQLKREEEEEEDAGKVVSSPPVPLFPFREASLSLSLSSFQQSWAIRRNGSPPKPPFGGGGGRGPPAGRDRLASLSPTKTYFWGRRRRREKMQNISSFLSS